MPAVLLDDAFRDPQRHVRTASSNQQIRVEGSNLGSHPRRDDLVAVVAHFQTMTLGRDHDGQPFRTAVLTMQSSVVPSACK